MTEIAKPQSASTEPTILISTYLEPEYVERIRQSAACTVLYAPELLPTPRYRNDHGGKPPNLTADDEHRWLEMLAKADIAFDFDWRDPGSLLLNARRLRWVQATSAGLGGFVHRYRLGTGDLLMTTAAGTHAAPLCEFAVLGALYFIKAVPSLQAKQRRHHWERHVSGQLAGRNATVVGLGSIGRQVATALDALGLHVTGVGRPGGTYDLPASVHLTTTADLDEVLVSTDVLVLACPLTAETTNLINASRVHKLAEGAIVINIARGQVIDEAALIESLSSGRLAGAALDVFAEEPLPQKSPLWDMPSVLISPHSASTVSAENEVLTSLFIDNLHRYLHGLPLRNLYHTERGY